MFGLAYHAENTLPSEFAYKLDRNDKKKMLHAKPFLF